MAPRPTRQASSAATKAIASSAIATAVEDEIDMDEPAVSDVPSTGSKRKRMTPKSAKGAASGGNDQRETPSRRSTKTTTPRAAAVAGRRKAAALSTTESESTTSDEEHGPPSLASSASSSSSARPSSPSDDEVDEGDSDMSSLPPSPPSKKPAKRAKRTPVKKTTVTLEAIEAALPYEYDPASNATAGATATTPSAAVPASASKPKRTPAARKPKKAPSPELDDEGKPVLDASGAVVLKTPKKGGGRKKVKEVVVYDVPEVEKLTTTFKGRLGYACLNSLLRDAPTPVFCSRTMRLATFLAETGHERLVELTAQNTADLLTILEWNAKNNIYLFRLSSEMFPFASHKEHGYRLSSLPIAFANLQKAGAFAKEHSMRITVHPGQWTQLASPREVVVENAILELEYQCEMLDAMGVGNEGVMVIHMGGVYGDKEATLARFVENYKTKVPDKVKQRLVLENDEICYSVDDLLPICRECEIPLVFDYHHDWINPSKLPTPLIMPEILATWNVRGGVRVKQHLSEPRKGAVTIMEKRGHADRCKSLPLSLQEGRAIVEREAADKAAADASSPPPAPAAGMDGVDASAIKEETGASAVKEEADTKPQTISVVGEDGKEVEERVIPEFGIRMGLPDDVDLMIEAKDKEQAVLHLFNLYGLGPVHRGSYLPPKPEPEFPDSSDSGEDEGAAECDEDGEPILGKAKKQGKVLTPMAKAKRAKAKAKVLAAKKRAEKAAEKKIIDEEKAVAKAEKAAERAAVKAEKEAVAAAKPKRARAGGRKKAGADLARAEAELEKEVELEDGLMQMETRGGGEDDGQAEALDRLESDLSDLEDES